MADWDVFVSYTHADQRAASLIQAFVEDYPLPGGRRLRVFRDQTDLTAGELGRSIPTELARARVLMLCCSPAAARSGWVAREVAEFHAAHGDDAPLVPLLLAGDPEAVVPEALRGREALILDLRAGWRWGRPRANTRVELLRAVAAAAGLPLRELIPWDAARRRRRQAIAGIAAGVAVAAVAATSTSAWLARRDAHAQALRRDAGSAVQRIEAGEPAEGLAALGHALGRDDRGLLRAERDVFRYWLDVLPPARARLPESGALLRLNGRMHVRKADGRLVALDLAEPFVAGAPWPGRLVAAGAGGVDLVSTRTGAIDLHIALPPGTRLVGRHVSADGRAYTVLARMTRIDNDEDNPNLPIPCSVLLLRAGAAEVQPGRSDPVPIVVATAEGDVARSMRRLPDGDLIWHDCSREEGAASGGEAPATSARVHLAVPRLPEGNDIVVPEQGTWEEAMRAAWPADRALTIVQLPAPMPEASRWHVAGAPRPAFPLRLGLATAMDQAAIDALGLDEVEGGNRLLGEVVELAAFATRTAGRLYWGMAVCGNSYVCPTRCTADAAGKARECRTGPNLVTLSAWQSYAPDGRRFAHVSAHMGEAPIAVFDLEGFALHAPDRPPPAAIAGAVFTADGARLVALTESDQVVVYAIAANGAPREERRFALGRAAAERRCGGSRRVAALAGSDVAVVTRDCTLHRVQPAGGSPIWQARLDVPGQESAVEVGTTAKEGPIVVLAGGRLRLFDPASGASLARPLSIAALPGATPDAARRGALPWHEAPATPSVDVGERRYARAVPIDTAAALAVLPTLDRHTLVSTTDGHTPLERLPAD